MFEIALGKVSPSRPQGVFTSDNESCSRTFHDVGGEEASSEGSLSFRRTCHSPVSWPRSSRRGREEGGRSSATRIRQLRVSPSESKDMTVCALSLPHCSPLSVMSGCLARIKVPAVLWSPSESEWGRAEALARNPCGFSARNSRTATAEAAPQHKAGTMGAPATRAGTAHTAPDVSSPIYLHPSQSNYFKYFKAVY